MMQPPDVKRALKTLAAVAATPFSQADTIPPMLYSSEDVHQLDHTDNLRHLYSVEVLLMLLIQYLINVTIQLL